MRYIRYAFMGALALCLIAVALANRQVVALKLLPEGLAEIVGLNHSIEMPLFLVIFAGILAGLLIGFVWEWLREWRIRRTAEQRSREVRALQSENRKLRVEVGEEDDVIALIENRPPPKRAAT